MPSIHASVLLYMHLLFMESWHLSFYCYSILNNHMPPHHVGGWGHVILKVYRFVRASTVSRIMTSDLAFIVLMTHIH